MCAIVCVCMRMYYICVCVCVCLQGMHLSLVFFPFMHVLINIYILNNKNHN